MRRLFTVPFREVNAGAACCCRLLLILCLIVGGRTGTREELLGTDSKGGFAASSSDGATTLLQQQLTLVEEQFSQQLSELAALQQNVLAFEEKVDSVVVSTFKRSQANDLWEQGTLATLKQLHQQHQHQQAGDGGHTAQAHLATPQRDHPQRFLSQVSSCSSAPLSSKPTLAVTGVCQCTNGIVVQGHNVTHDLNIIKSAQSLLTGDHPVVECSTLDTPKVVGSIVGDSVHLDYARSVATFGEFVFVAAYNSGSVTIVNATDPAHLAVVGNISVPSAAYLDVSPDGQHLFTAGLWSDTLVSVDISDRASPFVAGSLEASAAGFSYICDVAVSPVDGKYVYVSTGAKHQLCIVDVSDPSNMTVELVVPDVHGAYYITVSNDGNFVYVLDYYRHGLTVVNTTDPTNAAVVGSIAYANETFEEATSITASADGNFVYVATYHNNGVTVVNTTNPANPHVVGNITNDVDNLRGAFGVALSPDGDYLYVAAEYSSDFTVVDVRQPRQPTVVQSFRDSVNFRGALDVAVSSDGNSVFVVGPYGDSVAAVQWQNCSTA